MSIFIIQDFFTPSGKHFILGLINGALFPSKESPQFPVYWKQQNAQKVKNKTILLYDT
jgi:hypothetical protein